MYPFSQPSVVLGQVHQVIIEGGVFRPFSGAHLVGDSIFTWRGGRVRGTVDASHGETPTANDPHHDTLQLQPPSGGLINFNSGDFVGFEVLTLDKAGKVLHQGSLDLGSDGSITISDGTYSIAENGKIAANQLNVVGGTLEGAGLVQLDDGVSSFTLSDGMVSANVDLGGGADTFTLSGGMVTSTASIKGGAGIDEIELSGSAAISFAGGGIAGFEMLTKSGSGMVTQSGTLALEGSGTITISAGIYSVSSGGELQGKVLEMMGGRIEGPGRVQLDAAVSSFTLSGGMLAIEVDLGADDDTFTFSGGSIASGGEVKGGLGADRIDLSGSTDVSFSGTTLVGFEALTKSGSGTASQSGSLDLGLGGQVTISGGKYVIASGATLMTASTTLTGAVELSISGSLQGSVTGDSDDQTLVISSLANVSSAVDLGGGYDKLVLESSVGSQSFTVAQISLYSNIESLVLKGVDTVSWAGNLTLAGKDASGMPMGFQELALTSNVFSMTVEDTLTLADGSIIDLSALSDSATSISFSAAKIVLSGGARSIFIVLPRDYTFTSDVNLILDGVLR